MRSFWGPWRATALLRHLSWTWEAFLVDVDTSTDTCSAVSMQLLTGLPEQTGYCRHQLEAVNSLEAHHGTS